MICTKDIIKTRNGLFTIGAVVLNEDETWKDDSVKPVCSENDFMINFLPNNRKGIHKGKKHFTSMAEAEAYIWLLDVNGFSLMDL